jgi:hypothetical protein
MRLLTALTTSFVALWMPLVDPVDRPSQQAASWKTFASPRWGLSIDYPAEWTVEKGDDEDDVTFRSSTGEIIRLGSAFSDNPSDPAPRQRAPTPQCSTTTNAHGVIATVCVEPISNARRAVLTVRAADATRRRVALSTQSRDSAVFDSIVATARPYR